MARPPKADRGAVADVTLTLRLTQAEKDGLQRLVDAKRDALSAEFPGVQLTLATFVRGLIARELRGEVSTEEARGRILEALRKLSRQFRRMVPLWALRTETGLPHARFDDVIMDLEAERVVDLKISNDPESPLVTEHGAETGIRVPDRGLVWFAILP